MKHVSQFLLVSSLSLMAFSGESSILANNSQNPNEQLNPAQDIADMAEAPARPQKIAADGVNRKPAIEARVYVVDPSDPAQLYYYDYKDQKPEQGQNPPLQPSTF